MPSIKMVIWNANGLHQHIREFGQFLTDREIDIALISETHFTEKTHINLTNYTIYNTNHPSGSAHGGTAVIAHKKIHIVEAHNYKNIEWGSRLTNAKGKNLLETLLECKAKYASTGEPTYWPSDTRKIPDLIDFAIHKGFNERKISVRSCFDLSSDHSPILVDYYDNIQICDRANKLYNKYTNWHLYRELILNKLDIGTPLQTKENIESAITHAKHVNGGRKLEIPV